MESIRRLGSRRIIKTYSIFTGLVLGIGIVTNMLGIADLPAVQPIAAFSIIIGTLLLFGQILLVLNSVDKSSKLGWIMIRFAYVSLFVMCLAFVSIAGGTFISSFYLFGENSILAGQLFSSVGFTMLASFGICLSAMSYHTLSLEVVWKGVST